MPNSDLTKVAKEAAGKAAASLVQSGMIVGLGTGSTASYFITHLGELCRDGLQINVIATSQRSLNQAQEEEIPIADINDVTFVDLTVDGADEIDEKKRMIKGGGGALVREKIVASMSKEMIVIVDSTKLVNKLGKFPLPVEIIPFAYKATLQKLEQLGYTGSLRLNQNGNPFVTENHNYIYDIHLPNPCEDPEAEDLHISRVPGVVATGFFFGLAGRVVVGYGDGSFEIRE